MTNRLRRSSPLLAFIGLCYLPLLATSPGQVVADSKSYLYIDPDRMLSRAWSMWDAHVGMGTVTHQNIGFLWPMGPYYWAMEHLGAPDWVAERVWLGSILLAAGLGVRFLLRTLGWRGVGVGVAMTAYAFTPYLLTIAVRISVILLPFAALPWLIALTVRALRTASWRHPAAFALVVTTVGSSNATSIALAGIGPILWVIWAAVAREQPLGRISAAIGRIGILSLATNAWWILGLSVQATNGVDVLRYTESVATTAAASSAPEVLRGLGYWFFYGDDPLGPWIGPSRPFQSSVWLLMATFTIPVLALGGGAMARWRERSFVVLLAFVGLVLAVGVYPYADPSPVGRLLRSFLETDVGMAMRSMPRAAPLVLLALSMMLGAGVAAVATRVPRAALPVASAVIVLIVASLPPLWQRTFVPQNLRRPEALPTYWVEVGAHLDATDDGTRVLEVPGADFTSYRWGTTIDPVTPGLTDRPIVARELVPMGSAAAANILKAFDGRLQAHVAEATSVAPLARTMRAGQILVRSDLQYEHYDTPRPRDLWHFLLGARGLDPPTEFGRPMPNVAREPAPMLDELELSLDPNLSDPFPVTVLPVKGALPIVTTKRGHAPVVLAGDGDGIVDSAATGLIDGTELIRYSAAMTKRQLSEALDAGAVLVVTDSNRRRAERWGTIRFTSGYTEPAGLRPLRADRTDARLPVFPTASDDARTLAVQRGISANATSYGGRNEFRPEDRPAAAVDGNPITAWRTSLDDPVIGERLELHLDRPITTSTMTFLAPPPPINRWISRIALRFDGGPPIAVDLDDRSHAGSGQAVHVGHRRFSRVSIEVLADTAGPRARYGGLTSTGFAEVSIGDRHLDEAIRPPVDLLRRGGEATTGHPLAVVLTRLRSAVTDVERQDEEPTLVRLVELPTPRGFALTGTARLAPRATDILVDQMLGGAGDLVVSSSSRMAGPASRGSAAMDGDLGTAWTSAYGAQVGQWLRVARATPFTIDHLDLGVLADGRHSVPTQLGIEADGQRVATLTVPPVTDGSRPNTTRTLTLMLPAPVTTQALSIVVDAVRPIVTRDWGTRVVRTLPVAFAELGAPALVVPAPSGRFASGCRDDLLQIDGARIPVELTGTVQDAVEGGALDLTACERGGVALAAGTHELRGASGITTGIDLDRLVLRSAAGGAPSFATRALRAEAGPSGDARSPATTVLGAGADHLTVAVAGASPGRSFWLAFGQGWNDGWHASINGHDLGPPTLVDGFANGWEITPTAPAFRVALRFTPQRRVTIALWASLASAILCAALVIRRPGRPARVPERAEPPKSFTRASVQGATLALPVPLAVAFALGMTALGASVSSPVVGVVAGGLALVTALGVLPRWTTAVVAPLAMAASAAYVVLSVHRHHTAPGLEWPAELTRAHPIAWLAVLALVVDAVATALRGRVRQ